MSIQSGATVSVHYTGTLADGTEFDSSRDREPLEFVVGSESVITGFENAVVGRKKGDTVHVVIPAGEAYGEYLDELVMEIPRNQLPDHITPEEGLTLQITTDDGDMDVTIIELTDDTITLDANHPLAGEDLTFDIEIVTVK